MPSTEIARPPAGEDIDEARLIALPLSLPRPHIAIPVGQATVLLPQDQLERLARFAAASWSTEAERIACIDGQRAAALLLPQPVDADAHHLIAEFIEQGEASILSGNPPQPQPHVTVRYLASRAGPLSGRGDILFHLPGEPSPFLVLNWWVA
ncbi:hypothetical protein ACSFBF_26660 [Variovorax sp. ZT5P49]|uniref:hypothetical protein n=1 Tax=Variovorax sp. ZT5P49 TaxID=3443733 RepID=UPI003F46913C